MLTDTDALTKIEELARKDKPLVQKMSDFVKKVLNKIKAIYKAYNGESYAVRNGLQDVVNEFQKLSDVFAEGVVNASKNIKAKKNNTTTKESSGEVKHSDRSDHTAQTEITRKYKEDVDDVLNMRNTNRDNLVIGYTPEIMQKMKMPALPFVIGTGHVYSAVKTEAEARQDGNYKRGVHYHGLGENVVKNIYEKLQDPVMIIAAKDVNQNAVPLRSTHSVVAIVDVGQVSKSLLLPVEITAERTVNGERMDVNVLSSVYNKNVTNLVNESIALENSGDIGVYYAKKEASTLIGAGVQFPVQLQKKMASNPIIRTFNEKVNMKISDVTQSLQLKRWFGKSKVVNKDGTPRVVYHFTDADITQFDITKSGSNQGMTHGDGIYLSTSPTEYSYAGSNRMDLYASISKPFEMSLSKSQAQKIYDKYFRTFHEDKFHTYEPHVLDALQSFYKVFDYLKEAAEKNNTTTSAILSELGYDGVHDGSVWVAFEPTQVKSATDNIGTFDRNNPDIRYSVRGNGYYGYSMSNNAISAYEDGEKPISKWTKADIISGIANIDKSKAELVKDVHLSTLKEKVLYNSSYHHTSSHFNKTQFYAIDESVVDSITPELAEEWKKENVREPEDIQTYRGDIDYIEWSGSRKHPKANHKTLTDVNITEKGSFYIVTDDSGNEILRKKIGSNGTSVTNYSIQPSSKVDSTKKETWKNWDAYKNSSENIREFVDEFLKNGYDYSKSGKYYKPGRKPTPRDYESGNFFKNGEQRLSQKWDVNTQQFFFDVETYKDGEWQKDELREDFAKSTPKFSMRSPVEETKDLLAVHNLWESDILKSLKLGGLPMPSIAIIKAESGHSKYGDISLVFRKDTIDPKSNKKNKVYGGDAWTPTYPTIEYKVNEKIGEKISRLYYDFARKYGYDEARPLYNLSQDLEGELNRKNGEAGLIDSYKDDTKLMNFYLMSEGKGKVEPIVKETRTEMSEAEVEQSKYLIKALGKDIINELKIDNGENPKSEMVYEYMHEV